MPNQYRPSRGYRAHQNALVELTPIEQVQANRPDRRDQRANRFDTTTPSVGAGKRWDPDETLDLTPSLAPGLGGPGLSSGASGEITLAELRRRARADRTDGRYPDEIDAQLEAAREEIADGADPAELEPIDAT